jgi:hypothetical protein
MAHYADPNHFSEETNMRTRTRSRRHAERPYPADAGRAGGGLHDPEEGDSPTYHYADDLDRDDIIDKLTTEFGFRTGDLENAPDETLIAILKKFQADADEQDDEDEGADELPEPSNELERQEFAEQARAYVRYNRDRVEKYGERFRPALRRSRKALRKYCHSDDANSSKVPGGMLASGVEKSTQPIWDASHYRRTFAENEAGLRQMGIDSPEKLKRAREKGETFCDKPPRQAQERKSPLAFSERRGSVRQQAETFAESRVARGDSHYTGQSRADYIQIFMRATPAQREEFLSAT